jgi:hypothetical protein
VLQYEPLANPLADVRFIRLLLTSSLTSVPEADVLACEIQTFTLTQAPQYFALSYTWGPRDSILKRIVIGSVTCDVSKTVEEALRRLRDLKGELWIWVDQICINQEDDNEKSGQVKLMKEIYTNAHLVVAWLGPEEEDTSWLFAILENIGKASSDSFESGDVNSIEDWDKKIKASSALNTATFNYIQRLNDDVAIHPRLNGVLWRMSSLSYWMRLWIIQEFSVARKVELLRGSCCLPTAHASKLLRSLSRMWIPRGKAAGITEEESDSESSQSHGASFIRVPGMKVSSFMEGVFTRRERYRRSLIKPDPDYHSGLWRHQRARSKDYDSLFRVLATTLALEGDNNYPLSSDPRDQVFSLLQLANDSGEFDLFPNYQMTSREVYTEAERRAVHNSSDTI